jgi:ABC-2 type transport system ATP-binding protein
VIEINEVTMQYRNGNGIFDLSFGIAKGETFGFLGPNGAGKTTTIRVLLGFMKPDKGSASINGLDCWLNADAIHKNLGYIPGEIAFMNGMKGDEFLRFISDMRGPGNLLRRKELEKRFEINTHMSLRKMSKGMKQKIAIIAAFMHDPAIYVLDEPTNGLDPLMQKRFIELLLEEKQRGKTILFSSHLFDEIERCCDRAGIIREGKLAGIENIATLRQIQQRKYAITLGSAKDGEVLKRRLVNLVDMGCNRFEIAVSGEIDGFIKTLSSVTVENLETRPLNLEEVFMQFFGQEANNRVATSL